MREILFRGKRVDNGEWVYGYYYYDALYDEHIITFNDFSGGDGRVEPLHLMQVVAVDPETVGQATGMTDKNKIKIYEGDVVMICGGEYCYGVWEYSSIETIQDIRGLDFFEGCEESTVISNIHDEEASNDKPK